MGKLHLKGVVPPMITPFTQNGDVDYEAFRFNLEKWNQSDLLGYLVLGSNSETAYLTEDEKVKLIRITVDTAAKGKLLIAGTGMESERDTIALTNKAADMGIQAALILTPCYYGSSLTAEALIRFFTNVADNVKIPVLIYNVPKFTHVNIPDAALKALCQHPNIVGMKDSTGDINQLVRFQGLTEGADFQIMVGTASAWYPAMALGVEGGIFALANASPDELIETQRLFEAGKYGEARDLYRKLYVLNTAVTATYGIPGLKYACDLMGFKGGCVRSPLLPLTTEKQAAVKEIFKAYI